MNIRRQERAKRSSRWRSTTTTGAEVAAQQSYPATSNFKNRTSLIGPTGTGKTLSPRRWRAMLTCRLRSPTPPRSRNGLRRGGRREHHPAPLQNANYDVKRAERGIVSSTNSTRFRGRTDSPSITGTFPAKASSRPSEDPRRDHRVGPPQGGRQAPPAGNTSRSTPPYPLHLRRRL